MLRSARQLSVIALVAFAAPAGAANTAQLSVGITVVVQCSIHIPDTVRVGQQQAGQISIANGLSCSNQKTPVATWDREIVPTVSQSSAPLRVTLAY